MRDFAKNICRDDEGASIVEYALLLVLIMVVGVAVVSSLGTAVSSVFSAVASGI